MKNLFLIGLFMLLGLSQANAGMTKTLSHNLTTGGSVIYGVVQPGTPINATSIPSGTTITTDSVNQAGSFSYGYSAISLIANSATGVTPNIKLTYQSSYDNINWFSPVTSNGLGVVTVVSTIDTSVGSGNTWIVYNYTVYPYVRFNLQNNSATTDSVTAETMWQDYT